MLGCRRRRPARLRHDCVRHALRAGSTKSASWPSTSRYTGTRSTFRTRPSWDRPTHLVLDLDPPSREGFGLAVRAAHLVGQALADAALAGVVKTSGDRAASSGRPAGPRRCLPGCHLRCLSLLPGSSEMVSYPPLGVRRRRTPAVGAAGCRWVARSERHTQRATNQVTTGPMKNAYRRILVIVSTGT